MPARECLIGKTFSSWKIISDAPSHVTKGGTTFGCSLGECRCGTRKILRHADLKNGKTTSCGCARRDRIIHGHSRRGFHSRTNKAYWNMIQRCTNPNCDTYDHYGGAGVTVCDRWMESFSNFLEDVGECPPKMEIDRLDNTAGYEPGNVRWATAVVQSRNRRTAKIFTVRGITACLSELCEHFSIKYLRALHRLRRGWPIERALFEERHKTRWL